MKKSLILFCMLSASIVAFSQHITFRVQNFESHSPLSKVRISSTEHKKILNYSDDQGYFTININQKDTLLIEKENYHPIYLNVMANDFDTTHLIEISMVPWLKKEVSSKDLSTLQLFEYHFVHDTLANSNVKVHVFEGVGASSKRGQPSDPSFKIASVKLNPLHPQHSQSNQDKASYKLK